jgi:hypothetical protein
MSREILLKKTLDSLAKLPDQSLLEVSDFAEFLLHKIKGQILTEDIQKLASESKAFDFLKEEEDLYTVNDVKARYK